MTHPPPAYMAVPLRIARVETDSVWVRTSPRSAEINIPRSCIARGDADALDTFLPGTETTLHIEIWKARALNLTGPRDASAALRDFFGGPSC